MDQADHGPSVRDRAGSPVPQTLFRFRPVSFLRRGVAAFRQKIAVIDGERHITYPASYHERFVPPGLGACRIAALGRVWTPWQSLRRTFPR